MRDWRGTELVEGSTIVWAVTQSSNLTVNEGVVEEIVPHTTDRKDAHYCRYCDPDSSYRHTTCFGADLIAEPVAETSTFGGGERKARSVKLTALRRVTVVPERVA